MKTCLSLCLIGISALAWGFAQNNSSNQIDASLLARFKILYGEDAPSQVKFFSVQTLPDPDAKPTIPRDVFKDSAAAGDIASGVVIFENDGTLYLDARPCTGAVIVFNKPFRKKKIGHITCGGISNDKYLIEAGKK